MNNYRDTNAQGMLQEAVVVDTPSLKIPGAEPNPVEIVAALLDQHWYAGANPTLRPKPRIVLPVDEPRPNVASPTNLLVVRGGPIIETPRYLGIQYVDVETHIELRIMVPKRGGRQLMYDLAAGARDTLYRYAKALVPYQRVYYDAFEPDEDTVNWHEGHASVRLEQKSVPIFNRRVRGAETPASDPSLFPQGLVQ